MQLGDLGEKRPEFEAIILYESECAVSLYPRKMPAARKAAVQTGGQGNETERRWISKDQQFGHDVYR